MLTVRGHQCIIEEGRASHYTVSIEMLHDNHHSLPCRAWRATINLLALPSLERPHCLAKPGERPHASLSQERPHCLAKPGERPHASLSQERPHCLAKPGHCDHLASLSL